MHILLLNDDALPNARGGAAVIVDKLKSAYKANGHQVTLLTTHQDPARGEIDKKGDVISLLSNYPLQKRHRHCLGDANMTKMLTEVMVDLKPDAVHAHNIHTHLTYESLSIAKKYTDKIVLTAHDTFLVSFDRVRGRRYESLALQGAPMKMHCWEHLLSVGRKYHPGRNRKIRSILKETDTKVVAISSAVADFLKVNGIDVTSTIPNGIEKWDTPSNDQVNAFKSEYGIDGPTVLFVGRIRKDKGVDALLDAMQIVRKEIPNAHVVINGDKENLPDTKDSVIATGWISREKTKVSFAAADVVTTPSLYLDNFPTVNLEAMAAGKPVVGTCFGGTPEAVVDGETGIIINPKDTEQYANAIIKLLNDTKLASKMGSAGWQSVLKNFSLELQANAYLRLLTDV